jgi:4-hydroxymandelate oxidase
MSSEADEVLTVRDFEALARDRLDPVHYDYFAGGAEDEVTLRANEAAFARIALLPRVLRGAAPVRLATTLLGTETSLPVLVAPTAFHKLADPEGERATARAAAAAGAIMVAAMASTVAIEEVAAEARKAATDPVLWFQLYLQPDLEFTEFLVRRAEAAGCRALVVTVDSPVLGHSDRNDRNGFHDLPAGLRCENLRDPRSGTTGGVRDIAMSPQLSWWHLDWLRGITELPIVLKGVLHPEDARRAVDAGMSGLLVSNHGGRQLDGVPATVDVLPSITDTVAGRLPVLLDGGIRRGTDVVKALALGADAVAVGRPVVWGLAAAGEAGVRRVLELLRAELVHALTLCGCDSPRGPDRDLVLRRGGAPW